jgi:hypothetical protein
MKINMRSLEQVLSWIFIGSLAALYVAVSVTLQHQAWTEQHLYACKFMVYGLTGIFFTSGALGIIGVILGLAAEIFRVARARWQQSINP